MKRIFEVGLAKYKYIIRSYTRKWTFKQLSRRDTNPKSGEKIFLLGPWQYVWLDSPQGGKLIYFPIGIVVFPFFINAFGPLAGKRVNAFALY